MTEAHEKLKEKHEGAGQPCPAFGKTILSTNQSSNRSDLQDEILILNRLRRPIRMRRSEIRLTDRPECGSLGRQTRLCRGRTRRRIKMLPEVRGEDVEVEDVDLSIRAVVI